MRRYYICLVLLVLGIAGCKPAHTYEICSTVNIPLGESLYEAYADTDMDQLIWYLAASRQWQYKDYNDFSVIEHIGTDALSVRIYRDSNYKNYGHPQQLIDVSKDTQIDLKIYKKDEMGDKDSRLYSALVLKFDNDFFVCIDENSNDMERALTIDAVEDIELLLSQPSAYKEQLEEDESIIHGAENTIDIAPNHDNGYRISGYLNLHTKSSVGIIVKDIDTEEEYFNQFAHYPYTVTIGWSDGDTEYYYYGFDINISNAYNDTGSGDYRIELWAYTNTGEMCILSSNAHIDFWSR